jgi:hypothetical protein
MVEFGDDAGFALKTLGELDGGDLHCDVAVQPRVGSGRGRDIDLSLPPAQTRAGAC